MSSSTARTSEKLDLSNNVSFVEDNIRFAKGVVHRMMRTGRIPISLYDDCVSAAYLGLIDAALRYKVENGDFLRFAFPRIRGAIIDQLRSQGSLSRRAYQYLKAYTERDLSAGHDPSSLAKSSEATTQNKLNEHAIFAARGAVLYRRLSEMNHEETSGENVCPEQQYYQKQCLQVIWEGVKNLSEVERFILEKRYLEGLSFHAISRIHCDLSKSWICRLHGKALDKLRLHAAHLIREKLRASAAQELYQNPTNILNYDQKPL